jgi:predicted SprT family Zn-dependent metalloprotease
MVTIPEDVMEAATPDRWNTMLPKHQDLWLNRFKTTPQKEWSKTTWQFFASMKAATPAPPPPKPVPPPPPPEPVPPPAESPPLDIFANAQRLFAEEKNRLMNLPTTSPAERNNMAPYCLVFDRNPTQRLGQCRHGCKQIGFSTKVLQCGLTDKMVLATITHELCHAATPGAKHGPAWKTIMKNAGAENPRCFCSKEESALMRAGIKRKYLLYCPVGGPEGKDGCYAHQRDKNTPKIKRGVICPQCKRKGVTSRLILKEQF